MDWRRAGTTWLPWMQENLEAERATCPFGCEKQFCSLACFDLHKAQCLFKEFPHLSVGFLGPACGNLPWDFLKHSMEPIIVSGLEVEPPAVGLLFWCPSAPETGHRFTRKSKHIERVFSSGFKALHHQLETGKFMAVLCSEDNVFWDDYRAVELSKFISVTCTEFAVETENKRWMRYWLMHNFEGREAMLACQAFSKTSPAGRWPSKLVLSLALVSRGVLQNWKKNVFPPGAVAQKTWIVDALLHSTKGMAKPGMADLVSDQVEQVLNSVQVGKEAEHMNWILEYVDFKGSDVRLKDGAVLEGSRQAIPYPAFVWDWKCVQSYSWAQTQHINVLELLAFLNYLKLHVLKPSHHSVRFLHVFDSRVCSCVLSKGRSSSCMLNRILRRITALLFASDLYVLPLWTISRWNFSDSGSRAVERSPRHNAAG